MINTNTVPSAEEIYDNHVDTYFRSCDNKGFRYYATKAMQEHTRLHLEAMRDEKHIESLLERYFAYKDDRGDRVFYDYHVTQLVIGLINDYIKNNKL